MMFYYCCYFYLFIFRVADEQTRLRNLMAVKDKLPEANVNNFK